MKNQGGVSEHLFAQLVDATQENTKLLGTMAKLILDMHNDIKIILASQNIAPLHIDQVKRYTSVHVDVEREIIKKLDVNFNEFSILKILFMKSELLKFKIMDGYKYYKLPIYMMIDLAPVKMSESTAQRVLRRLKDKKLVTVRNRIDGNYIKINDIALDVLEELRIA